jgi:hypothetical protein
MKIDQSRDPPLPLERLTADGLIEEYGDEAYHFGCLMALNCLRDGNKHAWKLLADANVELISRGYHDKRLKMSSEAFLTVPKPRGAAGLV